MDMKAAGCGGVVDLQYPFTGRWLVQNSPANRVPSHGTTVFATSYAIDFVPVGDTHRTAPVTFGTLLRPEPPEKCPGFGRPVLAPARSLRKLRQQHRAAPAYSSDQHP